MFKSRSLRLIHSLGYPFVFLEKEIGSLSGGLVRRQIIHSDFPPSNYGLRAYETRLTREGQSCSRWDFLLLPVAIL